MSRFSTIIQCISNIGHLRADNQDAMGAAGWFACGGSDVLHQVQQELDQPLHVVVSDGMGGHPGGDVASTLVVKHLTAARWQGDFLAVLQAALQQLSDDMSTTMAQNPRLSGMGATVAGVVFDGLQLFHYNVGDSRVYRFSKGVLSQLSTDDRLEGSHVLTQVVGGHAAYAPMPAELHMGTVRLSAGDAVLLCSDGLTDFVSDQEIEAELDRDPETAGEKLVATALERGGYDNLTVIVARIAESSSG